jgi:hypothetical protein
MPDPPKIPLPKRWPSRVKSAMLHVISLTQFAMAYTRGWAVNCGIARVRLRAERDRACKESPIFAKRSASRTRAWSGSSRIVGRIMLPRNAWLSWNSRLRKVGRSSRRRAYFR